MKAFLTKYQWTIIYWIVFLAIVFYFVPRQRDYYLDEDIKLFKRTYLVWMGVLTIAAIFALVLLKTKSVKSSLLIVGSIACLLFIFQNLFLGACLFMNRQIKTGSVQKTYIVSYMAGTAQTKENFIPYDLTARHVSIDSKLINMLYKPGLKKNDTVTLQFHKGLLGIAFHP